MTLDAIPGAAYDGKVYAIDPAHDPNGRAVILRARMPNKDGLLRSGMFARVIADLEDLKQRILRAGDGARADGAGAFRVPARRTGRSS